MVNPDTTAGGASEKDISSALLAMRNSLKDITASVKVEPVRLLSQEKQIRLEQVIGEGLNLGYDGNNLWFSPEVAYRGKHHDQDWNTNTNFQEGAQIDGVKVEKSGEDQIMITISPEHPAATFHRLLKAFGWQGELRLPGAGTTWNPKDAPLVELQEDGGLKVKTARGKAKLAFTNVKANFNDGQWRHGNKQTLTINK